MGEGTKEPEKVVADSSPGIINYSYPAFHNIKTES